MSRPGLKTDHPAAEPRRDLADAAVDGKRVVRMRPGGPGAARILPRPAPAVAPPPPRRLGALLLEAGAVSPGDLLKAVVISRRENASLAEILLAHRWVEEAALTRALSRQWRAGVVDLATSPPDPRLIDVLGPRLCLSQAILPWRRVAGVTFIASARPEAFAGIEARLRARLGPVRMVLASERQIHDAVMASRQTRLLRDAELCVPAEMSCRSRDEVRTGRIAIGLMAAVAAGAVFAPLATLLLLTALAVALLACATVLRALAFQAWLTGRRQARDRAATLAAAPPAELRSPLPVISVMVPMFREADIAARLVGRLSRLTYPRELTDILLVVEEGDAVTRAALAGVALPRWMRVVAVPPGRVQTKPRALNYGLNFCRGSIIGVWDAEDEPEPDQLHRIARGFAEAPADVACLQGVLDYYQPKTNWISRCFTIEYGSWFRAVLPGMARMGLVVPLGGTTMFIRRDALEAAGGWDAWNVTEDADLGMRLARMGWRTRVVETVTREEPNCRARPWVKQRSRWHKGYFMTWATHMRAPRQLLREVGPRAFIAFQLQMAGVVAGFLLAPLLWSFWLIAAGLPHPLAAPLAGAAGGWLLPGLFTLFVASSLVSMMVAVATSAGRERRHLLPFVPTSGLYFTLGCLAAWKALYEVVADPFYWDKTVHGVLDRPAPAAEGPGDDVLPLQGETVLPEGGGGPASIGVLGQIG